MIFSVIICTLNRSDLLCKAVRSTINQTLPQDLYEIIIVDNGSSDGTPEIVQREFHHIPHLHYLIEPKPGLSQARNTGVRTASGEIVVFLDDDAVAEPEWLSNLLNAYRLCRDAWIIGGKIKLYWEAACPDWLHPAFFGYLGLLDNGDAMRVITTSERLGGGNFSLRKEVLERVGDFSTLLGRDQRSLLSGEEIELIRRVRQAGGQCYYTPGAVVHHFVPANRMKKSYIRQRSFWESRGDARIDLQHSSFGAIFARIAGRLVRLPYHLLGVVFFSVARKPDKTFLWETFIWYSIGYCTGILRDR